jgi:hypothetical protein
LPPSLAILLQPDSLSCPGRYVRQQKVEHGEAHVALVGTGDLDGDVLVRGWQWRQSTEGVVAIVSGNANLSKPARALETSGGFADLLDGGQEQADEDGDDGNHHQQLDQREAAGSPLRNRGLAFL